MHIYSICVHAQSETKAAHQSNLKLTHIGVLPKSSNAFESYTGKIIRKIKIIVNDVFDDNNSTLYGMVNKLKINTKKDVIRRELLFKQGDVLDPFRLEESLRILRTLPFIRRINVTIQPVNDYVDVTVSVHDTWTLIPQAAYSTGDGRDRRAIGLAESNVLGYGNRIEALYRIDDDIRSREFVWDDRRFIGSDYDMVVGIFDRTDGDRYLFNFESPFRSLIDTSAWSTRVETFDGLESLYLNGEEDFVYRTESSKVDASYTVARGDPTDSLNRYSLGYRYIESVFSSASLSEIEDLDVDPDQLDQNPERLAGNRRYSGPLFAFSHIEPDYISMNYIDRFERVQDFNLGNQYGVLTHLAPQFLGSNQDAMLYALSAGTGARTTQSSFLRSELIGTGRITDSGMDNSLLRAEMLYFNVLGSLNWKNLNLGRHTLAASWFLDYGRDFDNDRQLPLGADNGLRGYDSRTFNGDKRTLLNLENRVHLVDDLFQLVSLGASVFADVGGSTYESLPSLFENNLYADVGIGMIVGFPRSSGGKVLRVDLALPLRDAEDGTKSLKLRFILSSGQTFNAQTSTEELNASRPSVAVGF